MSRFTFPGSAPCKVDLHVHTPASYDFKDKTATGQDIVDAAISVGLDAIAITDHNDYSFIDVVKEAAKDTSLVVFPGVEISTRDGHLLAVMDPSCCGDDVRKLLILCGIGRTSGHNECGAPDTCSELPVEEVADIVRQQGGLAILAHFDGPKGVLNTVGVGVARQRIHAHPSISALELVDASIKNDWVEGKIYPVQRACIQGSDAHALDQIGSRYTWIRVAELCARGLRQAFSDPQFRIHFSDEYDGFVKRSWIETVEVSQGFFGTQMISFNPGLNCLIGGQGVGKSALIEFIRFALHNVSRVEATSKDHYGKLQSLLGLGGTVSVTINTSEGARYIVSRTFDDEDNPTWVEKLAADGTREPHPLGDINRYFPILAYSQGEAMSVARDPVRQLELIDSHIDLAGEKRKLAEFSQNLRENSSRLRDILATLGDLDDLNKQKQTIEAQIDDLEKRLKAIEAVKEEPAIRDHQLWIDEQEYLKGISSGISELKETLLSSLDDVLTHHSFRRIEQSVPETGLGHEAELGAVRDIALRAKPYVRRLISQVQTDLEQLYVEMRAEPKQWVEAFKRHQMEHQQAKERLGNQEVGELQNRLSKFKRDLSSVTQAIQQAEFQQQRKEELLRAREEIMNYIEAEKGRISTKRSRQAKAMSEALLGRVLISLRPDENRDNYRNWLMSNIRGRGVQARHLDPIVEAFSPRQLARLIRRGNSDEIQEKTDLSNSVIENFMAVFRQRPGLLLELEEVMLEDLPDIRMRHKDGAYRELDQLSTGQKFTVIILLALTDDDKPIVYDQPEDALDTAMIYTDIAQLLRRSKNNRQFIFATHNPNIAVAADLDLAIVLQGSATEAYIDQMGGIEEGEVKNSLVDYLEGGTEAMKQRLRKYEISFTI